MSDSDVESVFRLASKGKDQMTYQEFERAFKWDLPAGGEWETKAIRKIRDWMIKNNLASETAFERFLKSTGKYLQKKLNRVDFHKAIGKEEELSKFSAPEIDSLFNLLDLNQDGELDIDEWKTRIYEDSMNPLQMLRDVVSNNNLTPDDLVFKMQLRYWDPPMDFPKLCESLRKLDPTLSEI
jgi:Ca2+-binding EF-hand superfamily protein